MRSPHPTPVDHANPSSKQQMNMQVDQHVAQGPGQRLRPSAASPELREASWPTQPFATGGFAAKANAAAIRALDIVVSALLLILLSPVIAIAILIIRLDSPGPAFFRVDRIGFHGAALRMLKFRKMYDGASGSNLTTDDDDRFTRVGATLSKLKIDEIPQLWNVLRGEMSLVGPRPEDRQFVEMHDDVYRTILSVRPGITGLSQIAFAEESRILDDDDPLNHYVERILPQKVLLDEMYAQDRTLWLNLRILFWTAAAVVMRRQVAVHRDSGKMNLRRRKGAAR